MLAGVDDYVHVMWGASKDFGLNGLRIGAVHTRNAELMQALRGLAYFFATPGGEWQRQRQLGHPLHLMAVRI